jgi:cysteine desulfurase
MLPDTADTPPRSSVIYLDSCATTQVDPEVAQLVFDVMTSSYGNAGSRTHVYGQHAADLVTQARRQIAQAITAQPDEVLFTSGATEADNLAILGSAHRAAESGRRHIISTAVEHKAVLEPLQSLAARGFEVDLVAPDSSGRVQVEQITNKLRPETALVSVMHVNNETGVVQPILDLAQALEGHPAYLHVDAAQGFGKRNADLQSPRIDMISLSGHKVFAPQGIGALITRRRGFRRPDLQPLVHGGGQERGLRAGTLPVALIAGFGLAAFKADTEAANRAETCLKFRQQVLNGLAPLQPVLHGDQEHVLPHVINFSIPGADSEAVMLVWRELVAVSNGSACTSASYKPSHVLTAMGLPPEQVDGAIRMSWTHDTQPVDFHALVEAVLRLRG